MQGKLIRERCIPLAIAVTGGCLTRNTFITLIVFLLSPQALYGVLGFRFLNAPFFYFYTV